MIDKLEKNIYASKLADLKDWVEVEIEELEELINPFNEDYDRLLGILSTFQKVLQKIK